MVREFWDEPEDNPTSFLFDDDEDEDIDPDEWDDDTDWGEED